MSTTTATPRVITRLDVAAKATAAELAELDGGVHESAHAVTAALMGGRVRNAFVSRPGKVVPLQGRTAFASMSPDRNASVGYAGPWSDARWRVGGRPTHHDLAATLAAASPEDRKLMEAGGGHHAVDPNLTNLLERCWPSVIRLAGQLFKLGEIHHEHVLAALGLTEENAAHGLAVIRSGSAPGSFTIGGTVPLMRF
ncbi:hypothetical protein [Mycolicibacterium fortuitum]|uniref:hypothetical protein n=1 Tax=Mycolicibacterium fortuitum TaxID=1766 RepID=UPI0009C0D0EB|nr:hypothetical protein [Mycolicibacterium fortuitum]UHJ54417.1 hypothetical protein LT337_23750 [Mycolicibacterium fortuitum]